MIWNSLSLMVSSAMRQRVGGAANFLWQKQTLVVAQQQHLQQPWMPQLAGMGAPLQQQQQEEEEAQEEDWIWFAVPKRKHTKSRKRMKTTAHKRLKLKKNIVFDPRTGEVTLKHKLPFNWKDYLPSMPSKS
eukprot:CAMPEP_0113616176 /NCGR_PEP_ID=MMETSP0017_2-20120614/8101_1 /TAXON_ID=2856 /ORGANISM="Cylindrotheca closterium" /LENGTH=130 /DNA_ID=CAMNT_0000525475 /DNA_START=221 /DNA_END=610 /DNA_ORIENTATION=- /assembly_acc=CAM_ASM_000147